MKEHEEASPGVGLVRVPLRGIREKQVKAEESDEAKTRNRQT